MTGTVFRVEHEDGCGCYSNSRRGLSSFLDDMLDRHNTDPDGHPNPQNDVGIDRCMDAKEFCGFESMESLEQWFTEDELAELERLGFYVIKVSGAEMTAVGKEQVLFIKPEPEKILKKPKILLDIAF